MFGFTFLCNWAAQKSVYSWYHFQEFTERFDYANSRLLIPKDLKKYARIESEVVLSSSGNMIELWDKSQYETIVSDSEADFSKMAEEVMGNINKERDE